VGARCPLAENAYADKGQSGPLLAPGMAQDSRNITAYET